MVDGGSARNCFALGAGRRGQSEVALPPLKVLDEGGEPLPDTWGRQGKVRV